MGLVSLLSGLFYYNDDNVAWQTMIFTVLTLSQMGQAMSVRSDTDSLFTLGLRSNRPLLGAVLLTLALQLLVIYWGPLQRVFDTKPLSASEMGFALLAATVVFWVVELEKLIRRRKASRAAA
jgi:Ca2+-transporting ATPase